MEEQGSTKSPSLGEQGRNSTPLLSGWLDGWLTQVPISQSREYSGNGLHTVPAILFSVEPASMSDTHNTRRAHDVDVQLKTSEQWALDIYGLHWCSISSVGQCKCQAQHTAGWVREGGLCCQTKGKNTVWGYSCTCPKTSHRMASAISLPKHRHIFC